MKEQISYLNILKTISILCVCAVHYPIMLGKPYEHVFIILMHIAVPLFFMVNGALLFSKPFDAKRHYKRTLSLITVSIAWRAILLGLSFITSKPYINPSILMNYFLGGKIDGVMTDHFWFIEALVGLYILFPVLKICYDNNRKALAVFSAVIGFGFFIVQDLNYIRVFAMQYFDRGGLWDFYRISAFLPLKSWHVLYFVGGGLAHKYFYENNRLPTKKQRIFAGLAIIFGGLVLYLIKGFYTGFSGSFDKPMFGEFYAEGIYSTFSVFIMTMGVYLLFCGVSVKNKIVNSIFNVAGRNTLTVFYIHYWIVIQISPWCFENGFVGIIPSVIRMIAVAAVGTMLGMLLKRIPILKKIA